MEKSVHKKLISVTKTKKSHLMPKAFFIPQNQSIEHILNRFSIITADDILRAETTAQAFKSWFFRGFFRPETFLFP